MANKKSRKKLRRIRKPHIGASIVSFLLVTVTFLGLMSFSVSLFAIYAAKTRSQMENDRIMEILRKYDPSDEAGVLGYLSRDYFIMDGSGNVISSVGNNTCVFYTDEEEEALDVDFSFDTDIGSAEYDLLPDSESDMLLIIPTSDTVSMNLDMIFHRIFTDRKFGTEELTQYYWLSHPVEANGTTIYVRAEITFNIEDIVYVSMFFGLTVLVFVIVAVTFLINLIRNIVDKMRMRALIFMDETSDNHNWNYFLITGENILAKAHARDRYAAVNLVFVNYRNYVLCHSIEDGEKMLRKIYKVLASSLTDKREIASHSTTSNYQLLLRYGNREQLEKRISEILKALEATGGDHSFSFHAGIVLLDEELRGSKRYKNLNLDHEYNKACAATMKLEDCDGSGISFFDSSIIEEEKWIDTVIERQKDAVAKEEFLVYYQPKYDPRTNTLGGAEALIRWDSPEFGFISPGRFIPIFEKNGFITDIDHYMLKHVARDQKKWLDSGFTCVPVSVNISRAHFAENDLAEQIRDIVAGEDCPPGLIEIELTESAFFDDQKAMLNTITKLKEYGFTVSMDDFGSGYSSLNSLKDLPLDVLKLDAGFFRGASEDGRGEIVVSEAIRLAKNLNMKTVAEGVEEEQQVNFLATEGCDMIQGYYFAKPMPASEYEKKMESAPSGSEEPVDTVSETPDHDSL